MRLFHFFPGLFAIGCALASAPAQSPPEAAPSAPLVLAGGTLVGLLFGAVVGFAQMIRMALGASANDPDSSSASGSSPAVPPKSASKDER